MAITFQKICRSGNPVTADISQTDLYLVREIGYHRSRKNGHSSDWRNVSEIKVAELFAGVGGFRLGLEAMRILNTPSSI